VFYTFKGGMAMIKTKCVRLLVLFLALILVVTLSGCKENKTETANTSVKVSEDNIDLQGRVIKVDTVNEYYVPKEDDSELKNEIQKKLNRVMLARQKEVESKFNCKIEWRVMQKSDMAQLYNKIKNGEYDGDIVYLNIQLGAVGMLNENLIAPLDEYIDFSSGVYSNGQEVSVWKGKHYGINFASLQLGQFLFYNKTMLADEGLPDPYELMKTGQWTWEAFLDIVKGTTKDTNGDNVIDCWGIEGNYTTLYNNFLCTNNGDYIAEEGNQYKLVLDSPESLEALNFVTDLYKRDKVVYDRVLNRALNNMNTDGFNESGGQAESSGRTASLFSQGKAAFSTSGSQQNDNFEIGTVCYPKGPKASDYITFQTAGDFYAIPASVEDVKSVAVVMANLFSYFDDTKEEYITYDDLGISETIPDELRDILQNNIKYSWFIYNNNYLHYLNDVYENILVKNNSVDEAINIEKASITEMLDTFNQVAVQ